MCRGVRNELEEMEEEGRRKSNIKEQGTEEGKTSRRGRRRYEEN